jgi:hypothetical protein
MVGKETSWNKYTNTFNQLFQEKQWQQLQTKYKEH